MTFKYLSGIPPLENHPYEWAWGMHPEDLMCIVIYHWNKPVMCLSLHEAIESSDRAAVIKHIEECDNSPWIHHWQKQRHAAIMTALTDDYANI